MLTTACGKKEETPPEPISYTGSLVEYQTGANGYTVTLDNNGLLITVNMEETFQPDFNILPGTNVSVDGIVNADGSEIGQTITVLEVPLETELGYDGTYLMGLEDTHLCQTIQGYVEISYNMTRNGRIVEYEINNSYLLKQDEDTIYKDVVGSTTEAGVKVGWSTVEYIDVKNMHHYTLPNYSNWVMTEANEADIARPVTSFNPADIAVESFEREGDTLVVKGTCAIPSGHYVNKLLESVYPNDEYVNPEHTVSFNARFSEAAQQLISAEFQFTYTAPIETENGSANIESFTVSIVNVVSNDDGDVELPSYLFEQAPVVPEQPDPVTELKLYESVFGITAEEVTPEYIASIIDSTDEIRNIATQMILNYTISDLQTAATNTELSEDEQAAIQQLLYYVNGPVE